MKHPGKAEVAQQAEFKKMMLMARSSRISDTRQNKLIIRNVLENLAHCRKEKGRLIIVGTRTF